MTAFGLVMLGKLVLLVVFVYFLLLLRLYVRIQRFLSFYFIFISFCQMSTRCSSAKALSFWREERSH